MAMKDHVEHYDENKLRAIIELKEAYNSGRMSLEEAREELKKRVGTLKPYEIALAEQELKEIEDDECRKEDIQKMLELFDGFLDRSRPSLPEDHPIMCYYRENDALRKILLEIEDLVQYPLIKNQWLEIYDKLDQYRIHLSRKQNQLYSVLEQKGFDRPTTTMWTLDNFIRDEIRDTRKLLEEDQDEKFLSMQKIIVDDIRDLMQKEETVLYPTSLSMILPAEFEEMKSGDREIGFAWITSFGEEKKAEKKEAMPKAEGGFAEELSALLQKHGYSAGSSDKLDVATGKLTLEQINLIYKHLPVDISYVDENELVCFYSDTDHRVFPRSKNVIGRNVKNCHPRASVHIVEEIIEKFRSGEQDHAEFWINKPGIFIYIYYTAVRDENGVFRGVLEMMQDCTHIRSLTDSQTLLNWGNQEPKAEEAAEEKSEEKESCPVCGKSESEEAVCPVCGEEITAETRLQPLIEKYPFLRDELETISPKFKMLKTPLARVMLPKATVAVMAERSGLDQATIIAGLKKLIEAHK